MKICGVSGKYLAIFLKIFPFVLLFLFLTLSVFPEEEDLPPLPAEVTEPPLSEGARAPNNGNIPVWVNTPHSCQTPSWSMHPQLKFYCRKPHNLSTKVFKNGCRQLNLSNSTLCVWGSHWSGTYKPAWKVLSVEYLRQIREEMHCIGKRNRFEGPLYASALQLRIDANESTPWHLHTIRPAPGPADSGTIKSCASGFRYLTRLELLSVLHASSIGKNGRGMIISGDSMMRQLLHRTINFLRLGEGSIALSEYLYHEDSLYFIDGETGEEFLVVAPGRVAAHDTRIRALLDRYFPNYIPKNTSSEDKKESTTGASPDSLAILFIWDTYARQFSKVALSQVQGVPLHVSSFCYWWQKNEKSHHITAYLDALRNSTAAAVNGTLPPALRSKVSPTLPLTVKETIFLTIPSSPKFSGDEERMKRNKLVRTILREPYVARRGNASARLSLLDFGSIADARETPRTEDSKHFSCTWKSMHPSALTVRSYNNFGCRDPTNLAAMQWLGHLLLGYL